MFSLVQMPYFLMNRFCICMYPVGKLKYISVIAKASSLLIDARFALEDILTQLLTDNFYPDQDNIFGQDFLFHCKHNIFLLQMTEIENILVI